MSELCTHLDQVELHDLVEVAPAPVLAGLE